mmetsp:Transcript_3348/g.3797  ORF Transcript_3348/g.3797 Transcript_3348/m.3797 type:complete len:133 (-) Transcript_3348:186-584(-)
MGDFRAWTNCRCGRRCRSRICCHSPHFSVVFPKKPAMTMHTIHLGQYCITHLTQSHWKNLANVVLEGAVYFVTEQQLQPRQYNPRYHLSQQDSSYHRTNNNRNCNSRGGMECCSSSCSSNVNDELYVHKRNK